MLEFEPYSIKALKRALPYIRKTESLCSELSAGTLFMWQEGYDMHFCIWNDTLVVRENIGEQPAFTWPMGADVNGMIDKLIEYVRANNLALRFYEIDDNILKKIQNDERLRPAMSAYDPRWSDYIYSFEETLTFKGNKYKGQRNHINKFKRLYGEPVIKPVTEQDYAGIKEMLKKYSAEHANASSFERKELQMTYKLLDVYKELGLYAVYMSVNGEYAALSIGEVVGDVFLIHIEKALRCYEGIYPTMYQEFVKYIYRKVGGGLRLVNREDDSGDEGLRNSKMQYHPVGRVNKHLVHINSPAADLAQMPVIESGVVLTGFKESDKPAYLALNTDIVNNKFWGYDYREDEDILGEIDENTFYDSTILDMKAGDSINFAVRTSLSGDMIGEAILWNFTYGKVAEVGCRILPEYQGRGLGRAAFAAISDFAEKNLKLKVKARCFLENDKSYKMITACGYTPIGKDAKFYYFNR